MKKVFGFITFLAVLVTMIFLANLDAAPAVAQVQPTPLPVDISAGVYLPMSYITGIVGNQPVRVVASPDTVASKTMMPDGRLEIALPAQFGSGLAALTVAEGQEHVLRQLMKTEGDITLDTRDITLDSTTLQEMANSDIPRSGPQSEVFHTYMDAGFAKVAIENQRILAQSALDKQAEVAGKGLDTAAKIAISGDASQTVIASCWPVALLALAAAYMVAKGLFSKPAAAQREDK